MFLLVALRCFIAKRRLFFLPAFWYLSTVPSVYNLTSVLLFLWYRSEWKLLMGLMRGLFAFPQPQQNIFGVIATVGILRLSMLAVTIAAAVLAEEQRERHQEAPMEEVQLLRPVGILEMYGVEILERRTTWLELESFSCLGCLHPEIDGFLFTRKRGNWSGVQ